MERNRKEKINEGHWNAIHDLSPQITKEEQKKKHLFIDNVQNVALSPFPNSSEVEISIL